MKRKQRFFKLSAIVGCILLGAGMLLCGAGFVGMGCDLDAFTYPRVEANPQSGESASSESGDAVQKMGRKSPMSRRTPWTPWKSTGLWGMSPWSGPPVRRRWKSS